MPVKPSKKVDYFDIYKASDDSIESVLVKLTFNQRSEMNSRVNYAAVALHLADGRIISAAGHSAGTGLKGHSEKLALVYALINHRYLEKSEIVNYMETKPGRDEVFAKIAEIGVTQIDIFTERQPCSGTNGLTPEQLANEIDITCIEYFKQINVPEINFYHALENANRDHAARELHEKLQKIQRYRHTMQQLEAASEPAPTTTSLGEEFASVTERLQALSGTPPLTDNSEESALFLPSTTPAPQASATSHPHGDRLEKQPAKKPDTHQKKRRKFTDD